MFRYVNAGIVSTYKRHDANARYMNATTPTFSFSRNNRRIVRPVGCKRCPRRSSHDHVALLVWCVELRLVSLDRGPGPEKSPPVARYLQNVRCAPGARVLLDLRLLESNTVARTSRSCSSQSPAPHHRVCGSSPSPLLDSGNSQRLRYS